MRFLGFLKRLHREDDAQISFLAVGSVICFVALLSMVINTDDIVTERVHMQNVADATVLSAASWTARGLNMVSFINVLNTKLISTAVLLNALNDSLPVIEAAGKIQQAIFQGCSGVPFVGVFCAAMAVVVRIQLSVLQPLKNVVSKLADKLSSCDKGGKLWSIMGGLVKAADGISASFGAIGILESYEIAKANGATGIVVNGKLTDVKGQLGLPVEKQDFSKYCGPLKNGGPGYQLQGYAVGQGPLKLGKERIKKTLLLPFINFFSWPIFNGMVASHTLQVGCMNDPGDDSKVPVKLKDLEECKKYHETSRWSHIFSTTRPVEDGSFQVKDFVAWRPVNKDEEKSDDDAHEQEIRDQLGNINITPDQEGAAGPGKTFVPGRAYKYIDPAKEYRVNLAEVDCSGSAYPFYTPLFADSWDQEIPGMVQGFCIGLGVNNDCRRIDQWNKFVWYNSDDKPTPTPKSIGGYFIRVGKHEVDPEKKDGPKRYVYIVETVSLVDAGTKEMTQDEFKKYLSENGQKDVNTQGSKSSQGCEKPQPHMLKKDKDYEDRLKFIGFAYRHLKDDPPFWSEHFFEESPLTYYVYAQAQVYNYLSEDTFTQDWRVRLQQTSLLTSFLKSDKARQSGMGGFGNTAGNLIDAVNNH